MQLGNGYVRPSVGHDRMLGRVRATLWLVAAMAVLTCGAIDVDSARAGTYVMRNCSVPGHANAPLGPWTHWAGARDACVDGGGLSFNMSSASSHEMWAGEAWELHIHRPRTGPRSEIQINKVAVWYSARLWGAGQAVNVVTLHGNPDDGSLFYHWLVTPPPGAEGLSFEQPVSPIETLVYEVRLMCGPPLLPRAPEPCAPDHPTPLVVHGIETTLSESSPPTVLQPAGALLSGGTQSGMRTVTYSASDPQSGLAKVDVLLGGNVVKSHDLTPRCPYSDWTVCPASDHETLEIDTRAVPNGTHDLALRVQDAAGNERVVHGAHAVIIENHPPRDTVAVVPYAMSAKFKGSSRSTLTVSYGRRVSVRGRLTQGGQSMAGGTPITVLERPDRRGAREKAVRKIMTKADGTISIGVATSRPSRTVRLAYRPPGGVAVVSQALRLRVRGASRVRASLRGRVMRFSGTVLGRPMPKGGKRVQMQGRSPGSTWTTFKSTRTDGKGRFSGSYRLRVRRPGVLLKVRAVVPKQTGYGYLGSYSRAVMLRVR